MKIMPLAGTYNRNTRIAANSDFLVEDIHEIDFLFEDLFIAHKASSKFSIKDDWSSFTSTLNTEMFNKIS